MTRINLLLADDDQTFCKLAGDLLSREGFAVEKAYNVEEAGRHLSENFFPIVMLDMCLPELSDGFGLLDFIREHYPDTIVLMISGSGHIPDAVEAIKRGAYDFIEKPIAPDHLRQRIRNIAAFISSKQANLDMAKTAIGMVVESPAMQNVYANIIRTAAYDNPVLITGETGVGKELAAHAIHRLSRYKDRNMVCINCASIPKELFESELFGYEKGAFTGAVGDRKGYFEYAGDNSLFLDEISELPLEVQAKLLRVISEGEIQKLGGRIRQINTRIIAATNRNLTEMQNRGEFRSDLYYRLNAININIPPLRERKDDILQLATHFCTEFCNRNSKAPMQISFPALQWLYEQTWPGNVRELRSTIERGVIFATNDTLTVADLQGGHSSLNEPPFETTSQLRQVLRNFERSYLQHSLNHYNGNVSQTAQALGIDKSNLFKKIAQYKLNTHSQLPD
ncbi:MAG TPA: sigma-54 dependent transcriptional regulator [Candidatus Cloacimonadota bacterium]|nr:sigma-54 dependent transcriptional regulator [Candidatus Cloacimonadota bacterium]